MLSAFFISKGQEGIAQRYKKEKYRGGENDEPDLTIAKNKLLEKKG